MMNMDKETYQDKIAKEAYYELLLTFRHEDQQELEFSNSKFKVYKRPESIKKRAFSPLDEGVLRNFPMPHIEKFKSNEKLPKVHLK